MTAIEFSEVLLVNNFDLWNSDTIEFLGSSKVLVTNQYAFWKVTSASVVTNDDLTQTAVLFLKSNIEED